MLTQPFLQSQEIEDTRSETKQGQRRRAEGQRKRNGQMRHSVIITFDPTVLFNLSGVPIGCQGRKYGDAQLEAWPAKEQSLQLQADLCFKGAEKPLNPAANRNIPRPSSIGSDAETGATGYPKGPHKALCFHSEQLCSRSTLSMQQGQRS